MNSLTPFFTPLLQRPGLVVAADDKARVSFLEFVAASIRNKNTRRRHAQALREFLSWCESAGLWFGAESRRKSAL
jgi:hypothetical protein